MPDTITERCEAKGLRMTGQRRTIAGVLEDADDNPAEDLTGPIDDGHVADVERIERARIHGDILVNHGAIVTPGGAAGGNAPKSRIIAAMDRALTLKRNYDAGMPSVPAMKL